MVMCPSANQGGRAALAGRCPCPMLADFRRGRCWHFMDGLCRDYIGNEKEARLITPKISVIRAWFLTAEGEKKKTKQINRAAGIRSFGIIFAKKMGEGLLTARFPNFGGNCYLLMVRHVLSEQLSFWC